MPTVPPALPHSTLICINTYANIKLNTILTTCSRTWDIANVFISSVPCIYPLYVAKIQLKNTVGAKNLNDKAASDHFVPEAITPARDINIIVIIAPIIAK